jgi:hypothetical protein
MEYLVSETGNVFDSHEDFKKYLEGSHCCYADFLNSNRSVLFYFTGSKSASSHVKFGEIQWAEN